jgi:hypothetical protein
MPKILERLVSQLKAKGHSDQAAHAIATSALKRYGELDAHGNATLKGIRRGNMTPAQRAKDRAAKRSGRKPTDYTYNVRTNRATLTRSNRGNNRRP